MCLSAVLGVAGGLLQGAGTKSAAKQEQKQADAQIQLQKQVYDEQTKNFAPYLSSGNNALGAVNFELGLGDRPIVGGAAPTIETIAGVAGSGGGVRFAGRDGDFRVPGAGGGALGGQPTRYRVNGQTFNSLEEAQAYANANKTGGTAYQGFQKTPGYQFQFDQGTAAVNALAGAKGGLNSGRTLRDLTTFGQGVANQEYGNYFNRLMGLVSGGQAAAGNQANAGANFASNTSNAMANKGNAGAAGAIGVGNAFSGMANNLIGLYQYQKANKPSGAVA